MDLNSNLYDVREVAPRTWAISDHGMDVFYYVSGQNKALLIDCGFGFGDLKALARGLDDKPFQLALTHGHPDHAGGAWQFDEAMLASADLGVLQRTYSVGQRRADAPLPPLTFIDENFTFDLGERTLEVVNLAGHTPGSIGLLDRANRLLFSGDAVHSGQIWLQLPESSSLADFRTMLIGMAPYRADFDWLLWGHSQDPAPAALIDDLIAGVADLLAGRRKGRPHHWGEGEGLLVDFGSTSLLYKA